MYRQSLVWLLASVAIASTPTLLGVAASAASEQSVGGGVSFSLHWDGGRRSSATMTLGRGSADPPSGLPAAAKTIRVVFQAAGLRCCVAVDPTRLPVNPATGRRSLALDDLPLGPATFMLAAFPTDFAPTSGGITRVCDTNPAGVGSACDPTREAMPSMLSQAVSVNITGGSRFEAGGVTLASVPFLVDGSVQPPPEQQSLKKLMRASQGFVTSPVTIRFSVVDAGAGLDGPSLSVTLRQLGEPESAGPLILTPCDDSGPVPCTRGGELDVVGFRVETEPRPLAAGTARAELRARNLNSPPASFSFEYELRVRVPSPTVTQTRTFTPTSTHTQTPTRTFTSTPTLTATPTSTPTSTSTITLTRTPTSTFTPTHTFTPTSTRTPTVTSTPTPTPTSTATPTPTPICGNGVLSVGEQCDDGNRIEGDGCGSNCRYELIPGNGIGSDATDERACLFEWSVVNPNNQPTVDRRGRRNSMQTCRNNDASCDVDLSPFTRTCEFRLAICLDNLDQQMPGCVPLGLGDSIRIVSPSALSDPIRYGILQQALQALRDPSSGETGLRYPWEGVRTGVCTAPFTMRVPLRGSTTLLNGQLRLVTVTQKRFDSGPRLVIDVDVLTLKCTP
jgi:cysteine-rich repeat protein